MSIKIIGDVHGKHAEYLKLIKGCNYSVQLGDFGFDYKCLDSLRQDRHVLLLGNHDNYDKRHKNHLGDYGTHTIGGTNFFYVRGGCSIDRVARLNHEFTTGYKCWWEQEELTYQQGMKALELYKQSKPSLVLTHTAPTSISQKIGSPWMLKQWGYSPTWSPLTSKLLQSMWEYHQPSLWIHAHLHHSHETQLGKTLFVGLEELGVYNLNPNLE